MRPEIAASVVDGNALAGLLAEAFAGDATVMIGVCGGCGAEAPLAECVVELDESAAIVRCRSCTHTLFTVLQGDGMLRLIVAGIRELRHA